MESTCASIQRSSLMDLRTVRQLISRWAHEAHRFLYVPLCSFLLMLASFLNYAELRLYHKVPNLVSMLQTHVVAIEESGIYLSLCCTSHRFLPKSFCDMKGTKIGDDSDDSDDSDDGHTLAREQRQLWEPPSCQSSQGSPDKNGLRRSNPWNR